MPQVIPARSIQGMNESCSTKNSHSPSGHELFAFVDAFADSFFRVFRQDEERLGITQPGDDAGDEAQQAPQPDEQGDPQRKAEDLEEQGKVAEQLPDAGFLVFEYLQTVDIVAELDGRGQKGHDDRKGSG